MLKCGVIIGKEIVHAIVSFILLLAVLPPFEVVKLIQEKIASIPVREWDLTLGQETEVKKNV